MILQFIILSLIIISILTTIIVIKEKYDYEAEYRSAIIHGQVVAGGSVYSLYPEDVPGLGWVV